MSDRQPLASENLTFETAEEHALTRVPTASPSSSVGNIRKQLAQNAYDSLTHVAILEDVELVGVLTIEELFSAREDVVVGEIMGSIPQWSSGAPIRRSPLGRRSDTERAPSRWWTKRATSWASSRRTGFWPCCCGSTRRTWIVWVGSSGNLGGAWR